MSAIVEECKGEAGGAPAAKNLKYALMGFGNPLLDISADVDQSVLDKYGVKLNDAILAEAKHQPLYPELTAMASVQYIGGGATQNSIRVAQWMSGGQQDMTTFVGCVGQDDYGKKLWTAVAGDGVRTMYMEDKSEATGTCAVLINSGERSLVANLAAANNYKKEHYDTAPIQAAQAEAQVFYIAGFFLTVSPDTVNAVGAHAAESGKTFCLNLSAPFIIDFFTDAVDKAIYYADFVFCNESEAEAFATKKGLDKENLASVALAIAALPKASGMRARTVVFTQGRNPTIVACGGVTTEHAVEALEQKDLVDTNGAGDAMVGGFLSRLVRGEDVGACVAAGHFAARQIIQVSGCAPHLCAPALVTYKR